MDVLKGGVKELALAAKTRTQLLMYTHSFYYLTVWEVMFTNLLQQNGLPQHDTWFTNMEATEPEIYKIGNEIKMTVQVLTKTQKCNQLENSGI